MKRKTLLIALACAAILVGAAFLTGTSLAAGSCFTDTSGHWAETFICWLKDNGISGGYPDGSFKPGNAITRAEAAVLLNKQAEIPPSKGSIPIAIGLSDWYLNNNFAGTVMTRTHLNVNFGKPGGGLSELDASPTIPLGVYGRNLAVKGMELCYSVFSTNGLLSMVSLQVWSLPPDGPGVLLGEAADPTDRTDSACRKYEFASAIPVDFDSQVMIRVTGNTAAGVVDQVIIAIGRTTLYMEPTAQTSNLLP